MTEKQEINASHTAEKNFQFMVQENISAVYPKEGKKKKEYKNCTLKMKTSSSEMLVLTWCHDPQDTLNIHYCDNLQSHY
jgi:hypothetical protein